MMTIMMAKLYDALRAGNVPDEKARAAAEEAAAYENRAARIDTDLTVLKWMVATNLAMTIAILFKTFL
jgi:phage shock protein A